MTDEHSDEHFSDGDREALSRSEFAVCVATFYEDIAERLLNGAAEGFAVGGVSEASVHTYRVPGAFELPFAAKLCAESGRFAGVACLGAVIRGETSHYDHVCTEAARGIQRVQLDTGVPCAFGVITAENMEQALARSGGDKRDQGRGAAIVAMRMSLLRDELAVTARHHTAATTTAAERGWPSTMPSDGQGLSQLRQASRIRQLAKPLDGRHPAALQPEPAEGPDPGGGRRHAARLRLRALPEVATRSPRPPRLPAYLHSGSRLGSLPMADPSIERFRRVISAAAAHLEERRKEVNDLNVFPVADGDTGDNMALTLRAVSDELDRLDGQMVDEVGRTELVNALARAALMGARGNSGVILSQIVRGAAEELASRPGELVDPMLVSAAFARAADAAYESVREPAEGTMLTVFREMAHSSSRRLAHMEEVAPRSQRDPGASRTRCSPSCSRTRSATARRPSRAPPSSSRSCASPASSMPARTGWS